MTWPNPEQLFVAQDVIKNKDYCGADIRINTLKFRSCLTLFDEASSNDIFNEAIKKFYSGKRDDLTLQRLSRKELTDN